MAGKKKFFRLGYRQGIVLADLMFNSIQTAAGTVAIISQGQGGGAFSETDLFAQLRIDCFDRSN